MKRKFATFLIMIIILAGTISADDFKIGADIGDVVETDIQAQIDECFIPSYSINNKLAILTKDLNNYGFDVTWDNVKREIHIKRNYSKKFKPILQNIKKTVNIGNKVADILYSDISVLIDNKVVSSFNIKGDTAIYFDDLKGYGQFNWDSNKRILCFNMKKELSDDDFLKNEAQDYKILLPSKWIHKASSNGDILVATPEEQSTMRHMLLITNSYTENTSYSVDSIKEGLLPSLKAVYFNNNFEEKSNSNILINGQFAKLVEGKYIDANKNIFHSYIVFTTYDKKIYVLVFTSLESDWDEYSSVFINSINSFAPILKSNNLKIESKSKSVYIYSLDEIGLKDALDKSKDGAFKTYFWWQENYKLPEENTLAKSIYSKNVYLYTPYSDIANRSAYAISNYSTFDIKDAENILKDYEDNRKISLVIDYKEDRINGHKGLTFVLMQGDNVIKPHYTSGLDKFADMTISWPNSPAYEINLYVDFKGDTIDFSKPANFIIVHGGDVKSIFNIDFRQYK